MDEADRRGTRASAGVTEHTPAGHHRHDFSAIIVTISYSIHLILEPSSHLFITRHAASRCTK